MTLLSDAPPQQEAPDPRCDKKVGRSLRRQSYNTALLRAAADLMPAGSVLDLRTLDGIPMYNAPTTKPRPESLRPPAALKDAIAAADGLIFSAPEYDDSMPGVARNGIDWLAATAAIRHQARLHR